MALCWHFVLEPITLFIAAWFDITIPALAEFDMGSLLSIVLGMLGLGGLRSFEKFKGMTK